MLGCGCNTVAREASFQFGILGLILPSLAGCQQYAKVTWDSPKPTEASQSTSLAVGDLSNLNRKYELWEGHPTESRIGKHTFTVFALPIGNLKAHDTTPVKQSFDRGVRDALSAAGYDLIDASKAPANSPVLRGEVNRCWWWSYWWLWPLVLQGGQNELTLVLETREGKELWHKNLSRYEPGVALGGAYGFDGMINRSMTKLVRDIARECSSPEFKAALASR